jgi:hypothetical protein
MSAPVLGQIVEKGSGWGARVLLEPVIVAHGGFNALCNPRAAPLAGRGVDQIEKLLRPAGPQRTALDELREAAVKATDLSSATCPRTIPNNSRERLAFMEQRLASLERATAMLSKSFDKFYETLSEEQKARIDTGPRRWRWRL